MVLPDQTEADHPKADKRQVEDVRDAKAGCVFVYFLQELPQLVGLLLAEQPSFGRVA
jgi:hypothetical protein